MGTLPLTPKFREFTAEPTYRTLVEEYGEAFADVAMLAHAAASFDVTFFALMIALRLGLVLLMSRISRWVGGSRSSRF